MNNEFTSLAQAIEVSKKTTIFKYKLNLGVTEISVPENHTVLSCGVQNEEIYVWIMLDSNQPLLNYSVKFDIIGTGWNPTIPPENFLGTVQFKAGTLVFHVFYETYSYLEQENNENHFS